MKKITLLSALVVAGMATAQVQVVTEQLEVRQIVSTATAVKESSSEKFTPETYAKYATQAAYDGVDYYYAEGMMYQGSSVTGRLSYPTIMVPALESVTFKNVNGPTSWYTSAPSNALWAENSEELELLFGVHYLADMQGYAPYTTDHDLTIGENTYKIKGTQYAVPNLLYGFDLSLVGYGLTLMGFNDGSIIPMGLCAQYCDTIYGSQGNNCYMVGNKDAANGKYHYGTNRLVDGVRADTIGQLVRNVSPLKIYEIMIEVYNADKVAELMFPAGAEIKIELFNADLSKGVIESEPFAETVVTAADYVNFGAGSEWIGNLVAKFYEEDLLGTLTETPVWAEGDFYLQITGFNESGCDFGIRSDYYTPVTGTTVYTVNGEMVYGSSNGGMNLNIGYIAYWPALIVSMASEALVAPVECGVAMDSAYSAIALYTNVSDLEDWTYEAPEWLEVVFDNTYLEENGYVLSQITAQALPVGETGRVGVVTIDADGKVCEVIVKQGEVQDPATGVENVESVLNGKTYNLLGVEVDENYKGIVIKNGQKFIQ